MLKPERPRKKVVKNSPLLMHKIDEIIAKIDRKQTILSIYLQMQTELFNKGVTQPLLLREDGF